MRQGHAVELDHAQRGQQGQQAGEQKCPTFDGDQDDERQQKKGGDQAFDGVPLPVS